MRSTHRHPRHGTGVYLMLAVVAVLALGLALLVAACGGTSTTSTTAGVGTTAGPATTAGAAAGGAPVEIKGFAFNPASVTIKVGETVTWTNKDGTTHTVTADNAGISKAAATSPKAPRTR